MLTVGQLRTAEIVCACMPNADNHRTPVERPVPTRRKDGTPQGTHEPFADKLRGMTPPVKANLYEWP